MKKNLSDLQVGDMIMEDGDSSFCDPSRVTVKKITVQYDKHTGQPYNVIHVDEGAMYDSRDGSCIKGASAYYIRPLAYENEKGSYD